MHNKILKSSYNQVYKLHSLAPMTNTERNFLLLTRRIYILSLHFLYIGSSLAYSFYKHDYCLIFHKSYSHWRSRRMVSKLDLLHLWPRTNRNSSIRMTGMLEIYLLLTFYRQLSELKFKLSITHMTRNQHKFLNMFYSLLKFDKGQVHTDSDLFQGHLEFHIHTDTCTNLLRSTHNWLCLCIPYILFPHPRP